MIAQGEWLVRQDETMQTGYIVNNKAGRYIWLIDQSVGNAATFDNAFQYKNLGLLYNCP
jgi:hypothetical protein